MRPHRTPPAALIAAADSGVIDYALLERLARETSRPQGSLLDDFADYVARRYHEGHMTFEVADRAMNAAYSLAVQEEYLAANDRTLPSAMMEVFEAFDAGEYYRRDDPKEVDPELKYTKPLLKAYLSNSSNDA